MKNQKSNQRQMKEMDCSFLPTPPFLAFTFFLSDNVLVFSNKTMSFERGGLLMGTSVRPYNLGKASWYRKQLTEV